MHKYYTILQKAEKAMKTEFAIWLVSYQHNVLSTCYQCYFHILNIIILT